MVGSRAWWDPGAEVIAMVSAKGGKFGFVYTGRQNVYRKLRSKGHEQEERAARISNAGRTHAARSTMARKGALHRKAHAYRAGRRR
jgi:hypothetical protein